MYTERRDAVRRIKTALREITGLAWSVHGGRGTAWGWITVEAPKSRRVSIRDNPAYEDEWETPDEPRHFEYRRTDGHPNCYTSESDCETLAIAFGRDRVGWQGVSISPDRREIYVRAIEATARVHREKESKRE